MAFPKGSVAVCLALTGFIAWGQDNQVAGPVAGYVFDSAGRFVRPVLGIPGASLIGAPLRFDYSLASAVISPPGDTAVALAADGAPHLIALAAGAASEIAFNGLAPHPDRVVYSPSGASVALIAGSRAQVVTGLGTSPAMAGTVELATTGFHRAPGSIALSDDGGWILESSGTAIQLIGVKGGRNTLLKAGRRSQVAFAPASHDAAVLDQGAATVLLIRDAPGGAGRQMLPAIAQTSGLAFSADGRSLYLAGTDGVTVVDVASGTETNVTCDCTATGMDRMGSVYRINQPGSAPLWLLDPTSNPIRTVFVPAAID